MNAEISHLESKIDSHISNQEKINDRLVNAIDRISETVSKVDAYQTEVNAIQESIRNIQTDYKEMNKSMSDMKTTVVLNSELTKEFNWIKKAFYGFIVAAVLGGGYMTKVGVDSSVNQEKLIEQQAEAFKKIAESIGKE